MNIDDNKQEKKFDEEEMDDIYDNNAFIQENNDEMGVNDEVEKGKNENENSDFRLVVGLNYYKHEGFNNNFKNEESASNYSKFSRKIYFFPCDISLRLFEWESVKELTDKSYYYEFHKFYKDTANFSLDDIEGIKLKKLEEEIITAIKVLIEEYKINHVYVYGYNKIIQRLFESLNDVVKIYNIKEISPSCTPDPISLESNHRKRNQNYIPYKKNQMYEYEKHFIEINDVVMKISRIFTLGYDQNDFALRWDNINGKTIQGFIGREKTVVEIKNYIRADYLSKMNILSLAFLRRILEKDMNHFIHDVEKKAKDLLFLTKIIYLCLVKPNYFSWSANYYYDDNLNFTIACPTKTIPITFNNQKENDSDWLSEELVNFIDMHSKTDEPNKETISYGNDFCYRNLLKFTELLQN